MQRREVLTCSQPAFQAQPRQSRRFNDTNATRGGGVVVISSDSTHAHHSCGSAGCSCSRRGCSRHCGSCLQQQHDVSHAGRSDDSPRWEPSPAKRLSTAMPPPRHTPWRTDTPQQHSALHPSSRRGSFFGTHVRVPMCELFAEFLRPTNRSMRHHLNTTHISSP
jgi:hypothetical protein